MSPKDRLAELTAAQDVIDDGQIELELDPSAFMDEFFTQVEEVRTGIESIRSYIEEVRRLQGTVLASPTNEDKTKDELDERMAEIKKTAQRVRNKLKAIETSIKTKEEALEDAPRDADLRIRSMQFWYLSQSLKETMTVYNSVQLEHRENLKKRIQRQLEITGKKTDDSEIERMLESGNVQVFTDGVLMETKQARQTLEDIEARHKDILKLEQSIRELHEMFMDVAMLVEAQGEMINNIERNIEQTVDYVKSAKVETKEAVKLQSKARRKKFILLAILLVVIAVIVLIVVLSVS